MGQNKVDHDGMRKHYSATFKAQIVQEVLRGEKTMSQIASRISMNASLFREHQTTITNERFAFLRGLFWLETCLPPAAKCFAIFENLLGLETRFETFCQMRSSKLHE